MQSKNFVRGGGYGGQQKMGKLSERGVHKKIAPQAPKMEGA